MIESDLGPITEEQKEQMLQRQRKLARELAKNKEGFPFPGISQETLVELRANDKESLGWMTPIDEIIARMKKEGVIVGFGEDGESNVFAAPADANLEDGKDLIFPWHLEPVSNMDESFKELILTDKALHFLSKKKSTG